MSQSHVILIHGAWQGSWVWRDFAPRLAAAGLTPHAIDLPGNGSDATPLAAVDLDLYVAHVRSVIAGLDGPVALVGHSGGGVVATAVGEALADRVGGVAYIAGMMLPPGMGFGDLLAAEDAAARGLLGIGPYLDWSADRTVSSVPPEAGARIFLNDMDYETALAGARNLTPQAEPGRALATGWTRARFGRLPRLYIECSRDLTVLPVMQQRMQDLVPGARRAVLDVAHAPHISAPDALAAVLVPFLAEVCADA